MKRIFIFLLAITFISLNLKSQSLIKGTVKEQKEQDEAPLPFANVFIEGTTIGTTSNFDGYYELSLKQGSYNISFSFVGLEKVTRQIVVDGETPVEINVTLAATGQQLQEVKVAGVANRESETMLLMDQKKAVVAVESIGAKELSIKGVSDAEGAVTKITGITKQEGEGTLNVRGLGDRYNTTTLNGLPIPSNNAEVKNIDLTLFSTDIISHINIDKTYSSPLYGDFGGANINIVSKQLVGKPFLDFGLKSGQNSSLFGVDKMVLPDGPGMTGFYNGSLPNIDAIRDISAYGFENKWNTNTSDVLPKIGFGLAGGKEFEIGKGKLNSFFTFSYDNEDVFTERIERMVSATGTYLVNAIGEEYQFKTQSNGMLNLNYEIGNSKIYLNSLMLNSSESSLASFTGEVSSEINDGFKRRGEFERNFILVNQLLGDHQLNRSTELNWAAAYNYVMNTVPDRRENLYSTYNASTNIGELDTESAGANYRYFHTFDDNEVAGNITLHKLFGQDEKDESVYKAKLSLGYSGKYKQRTFNNYQFNHGVYDPTYVNVDNLDNFYNQENYINNEFRVTLAQPRDASGTSIDGEGYTGLISVNSGFALFEYNLSKRFLVLLGMRAEQVYQQITTRADQITGIGSNVKTFEFDELKYLPSLSLKYTLNSKQNLRFAASKTYTLPQLQEMPFMSFTGISEEIFGNPYLVPSEVYNADIKWEFFPNTGELFSATIFGKFIIDPINKTTFGGLDGQYVTANTGDWAYVYGIELDGKKDMYNAGGHKVFAAANISLMTTQTELDKTKMREETEYNFTANFNDTVSALQGAAPFIANASVGYSKRWNDNSISAVAVYNYTSDRLYAFGQDNVGDEYFLALNTLDFIVKTKFKKLGIDLSAKNLLDTEYTRVARNRIKEDKDHIIRQYKKGISFSISLKYKF